MGKRLVEDRYYFELFNKSKIRLPYIKTIYAS